MQIRAKTPGIKAYSHHVNVACMTQLDVTTILQASVAAKYVRPSHRGPCICKSATSNYCSKFVRGYDIK